MNISGRTKIGSILKNHPGALEAIVSLSPRFEKLRNPLLRNLMAGRTTLAEAARIGGCELNDFYTTLQPLGFTVDGSADDNAGTEQTKNVHPFIAKEKTVELDVRTTLAAGTDPLQTILATVKSLKQDEALKIINTFEPTPLMHLLGKKGWQSHTEKIAGDLFHTFFYRSVNSASGPQESWSTADAASDWNAVEKTYSSRIITVDVRHLQMPQPMMTILENLEKLPADHALYVYHQRIPVYLLQELKDRDFDYRIREVTDGDVRLLIFKNT